jgi:very-long-chain enoyl-CoA reductase
VQDSTASYTLVFKDLGLQIGWDTVFYIEYFGPILMHSLFYWLPQLFYSQPGGGYPAKSYVQTLAYVCVVAHYVKRELETAFVHRFSAATMPFRNVFKNSFHVRSATPRSAMLCDAISCCT